MSVPDYRLKPLKRFERPYFSPRRDSYEIDYMEHRGEREDYVRYRKVKRGWNGKPIYEEVPEPGEKGKYIMRYLFCINLNTRYLMVYPVELNQKPTLEKTAELVDIMNDELIDTFGKKRAMKHLRSDADSAFGRCVLEIKSNLTPVEAAMIRNRRKDRIVLGEFIHTENEFTKYLSIIGVDLYLNPSKYTNKSRIVDRAIRTIRDKLGNQNLFFNTDIVYHIVDLYNQTPHAAFNHEFTPLEVQNNLGTEDYFIRENNYKLQKVRQAQYNEGLFRYQRGNILLVHIPHAKTSKKFRKRRRNFDTLAVFDGYLFGNVQCFRIRVMNRGNSIEELDEKYVIPIYFTKYVTENINSIPWEYRLMFSDDRGLQEETIVIEDDDEIE